MFKRRKGRISVPESSGRQRAENAAEPRPKGKQGVSDPRIPKTDFDGPKAMRLPGQDDPSPQDERRSQEQNQSGPVATPASQREQDCRRLVVGRDICLSGEIKACDALTVEGRVEANLADGQVLEITASGFFKGSAVVDRCDISGCFEGDLVVHDLLRLTATARVSGAVYYGDVEIARGARIKGVIEPVEEETVAELPAERALTEEVQRADLARIRIKPQFPRSMKEILDAVEEDLDNLPSESDEPSAASGIDSPEEMPEGVARISVSPKQRRSE